MKENANFKQLFTIKLKTSGPGVIYPTHILGTQDRHIPLCWQDHRVGAFDGSGLVPAFTSTRGKPGPGPQSHGHRKLINARSHSHAQGVNIVPPPQVLGSPWRGLGTPCGQCWHQPQPVYRAVDDTQPLAKACSTLGLTHAPQTDGHSGLVSLRHSHRRCTEETWRTSSL